MAAKLPLSEVQARFLEYQDALNHSPKQISHYQTTFRDFNRFLTETKRAQTVAVLVDETFQAFASWMKRTPLPRPYRGTTQRSMNGIAGHLKDLKAFVRWGQEKEPPLITWKVRITLPKVPQRLFPICTDAELVQIFTCPLLTGQSDYAIRNRALLALLLDTGVRLAEIARLTPASILGNRYLRVIGKGDKERIVPFTTETALLLADWLEVRARQARHETPELFLISYHGISMLVRRIAKETGIHLFPHKLRHTAATKLLIGTGDLYFVKEVLGHASTKTTEEYLTLTKEDLQAKHATASPYAAVAAQLPQPVARKPLRTRLRTVE